MNNAMRNFRINGNIMAKQFVSKLNKIITQKGKGNTRPRFDIVLAGDNPSSQSYVKKKIELAKQINIEYRIHRFDRFQQNEVKQLITQLNSNPESHGILAQLPFPDTYNKASILQLISPQKDIDCLHPYNLMELMRLGQKASILPCTPRAILHICDEYKISVEGRKVLVIGRSNLVGFPISLLMLKRNATVTIAHKRSSTHLTELIKQADIIIAAAGSPKLVKQVKPECIIFDVGINKLPNSKKLVGDVDIQNIHQYGLYTPVPGGIGPLTVSMLMKNVINSWLKTL